MRRLRGLRLVIVGVAAAIVLAVSASALAHGRPSSLVAAIPPLLLLAAALFERRRYSETSPPSAAAHPTGERFRDPIDGHVTEVYYDESTGARSYRPVS